ncbi:MAG: hypothetical protein QXR45_06335 [Candidatus Bathyarchaeia archaeon]
MSSIKEIYRGKLVDFLINNKDKILLVLGTAFLILSFVSIPSTWGFDKKEPLVFLFAAAFCLILAFLSRFSFFKNSNIYEKIFAISGILTILFFVSAIISYMFVEYRTEIIPMSIRINKIQAIPAYKEILVITHPYASVTTIFLMLSIILLAYAIYIKSKYL